MNATFLVTFIRDRDFAFFSPLGSGREIDAQGIGVGQVARELAHCGDLFPAAADRLRLRLYGDREGRWAWSVLSKRLDSLDSSRFFADVELVTSLMARQPSAIELGAQGDELRSRAFEPGVDGSLPRIRTNRRDPDEDANTTVHISAVIGDLIKQFRSTISPMAAETDVSAWGKFDARVFFHEPVS